MTVPLVLLLLAVHQSFVVHGLALPVGSETSTTRWNQPCRGSGASGPELEEMVHMHTENERVLAHRIWLKAYDVIDVGIVLRDKYSEDRIQSIDLRNFVNENVTLPGFPDHRALSPRTTFLDRLHEDYRRAAVSAIFVEQIKIDEEASSFSPSYFPLLQRLEAKLYPFLCFVKMTYVNRAMSQLPVINGEFILTSLRNMQTDGQRHMRDYRILKDLVSLFYSIQTDYDTGYF